MRHLGLGNDSGTLVVAGGISVVQLLAVFPVILYIDRLGMFQVLPRVIVPVCTNTNVFQDVNLYSDVCSMRTVSQN